jgi:hypothetical protein
MKALLEVFYQPGKVFEGLPDRRYAWVLPILFDALLVLLITILVPHYMGRENLTRQQLETFASRMSPEQMQAAIAQANTPARIYMGYVFGVIGTILVLLVISGALMAFAMMTSRTPRFGAMLSMVSIAYFPYWVVVTAMTALILIASPDPTSLNASNLIATNVGAFMNKAETSKGLYSLMTSIDVLSFAEMFLLALGFSKLTKSNLGFGLAAMFGLWALYVASKMGLSLLFG